MKKWGIALLLAFFVLSGAFAEYYPHKDAKVKIFFPDNWTVDGEPDLMEAYAPDSYALFVSTVLYNDDDLDAALSDVEGLLVEMFDNYDYYDEGIEDEVNGLWRFSMEGYGTMSGVNMEFLIYLYITPSNNYLLMIGFCASDYWESYEGDMYDIVDGVQPL